MTETTIAGPGLQLSNGDHVCVFCRGGERDELLVPFLTAGVSAGDRCLAVVDTSEPEELLDALGTAGGAAHRADQLTVLASRDVYLTDRGFDMDGMLDFYGAELRGVAEGRSGYDCIRTAGEMTWALRDIPGVEDLLAYEARGQPGDGRQSRGRGDQPVPVRRGTLRRRAHRRGAAHTSQGGHRRDGHRQPLLHPAGGVPAAAGQLTALR